MDDEQGMLEGFIFWVFNTLSKKNKPLGAGDRCLSCPVEDSCSFSAKKIYLNRAKTRNFGWPVSVLSENPSEETITEALQNGPYGRCVYECDNDVVDNQVVNMFFEGGATASFTMMAFTEEICVRKTRIFGTRGELEADGKKIKVFNFLSQRSTFYTPDSPVEFMSGHGGGDYQLMASFIDAVKTNNPNKICSPENTLKSHLVVFAAERSRIQNEICNFNW